MVRGDDGPAQEADVTVNKMDCHGSNAPTRINGGRLLSYAEEALPRLHVLSISQLVTRALLSFG